MIASTRHGGIALLALACGCSAPRGGAPVAFEPPRSPSLDSSCLRDDDRQGLEAPAARVVALRIASWDGDEARLRRCLEDGADPNLAWPGAARWPELTRVLLEAGASPHGPEGEPCPACVAAGLEVDSCPLCDAARHGSAEVVGLLVASGAEADAPDGPSGARPLHLAAQRHALDVVRALLEAGADVNARDGEGKTALMYAVEVLSDDLLPIARLLVDAGADTHGADHAGKRAIDYARETLGDHLGPLEPLLVGR